MGTFQDLRHGAVLLRRDAATSALIVLVLALGIGGNAAIFTLLKAAFLDPLPYRDARRLVTIIENTGWVMPSVKEYQDIRARNRTLDQVAFAEHLDMQLTGNGEPARVFVARVTASFLPVLGVRAALGRTFLDEETQPGRAPSVVLTDAFWRSRTAADPHIIGRTLWLDGQPAMVVGVLPRGFQFDYPALGIQEPVDFYISSPSELTVPIRIIARLHPGVTLEAAASDMRRIARELTSEHPERFTNPQHNPSLFSFITIPLRDALVGTQRSLLWLLLGGSGVLLLIACANTAQLLLARSLRRAREVAIRSALGASRRRLIRQFLLEGMVLAVCGGAAGLLAARWILRILLALLPTRNPLLASAHVDARAIAFTMLISLVSAIVFAIVPAVKGSRWEPGPGLTSRVTTGEGNRWRHAIIGLEAALSMFLLCGAGLVVENLRTLLTAPMGFDPAHVLAMRLKLSARHENSIDARAGDVFQEYLDRIEAIPGVESAATVTGPPLRPARGGNAELLGVTDSSGALKSIIGWYHLISADYFRALHIPLLAGRTLRRDDAGRAVTVAVVNEEFARQFGFGADIVGKQIDEGPREVPTTIVGMVGNVRTRGLQTTPFPEVYLSHLQLAWGNTYLVVRSALPPGQLLKQVKTAIQSANSDQPVFGVETMDELISDAVAEPRFDVFLIGAFALIALSMAAAGMYSVISCLVSQRTGEIAIRMALGASRGAIVRTILGATVAWVLVGLACGLALGLATRNTVRSMVNVAATGSAWMYATLVLFFFAVTLAAAYVPMRRASRLDPAAALRCE